MRINLLYNKIVADTISESFVKSFNENALPKLSEKFSDVEEAVIYEDYLSDGIILAGTFFCPLTLVRGESVSRAFASWRCDSKKFENAVPYAYLGKEALNIEISDSAPPEIEAKVAGRVPFFAKNAVKCTIDAQAPTKTFLSGKYSQSFVDIMRYSVTRALEAEFSIEGLSESSLELSLVFAPESFMEHVLDNVSYRRVLVSAKACAPRDLWIKWTRLDAGGTYTVSSHVKKSDILFEICDDVPEKIREREYRYLIKSSGISAYKNAMSRKNFTEWRELLKRVIKRGEVVKLWENNNKDYIIPTHEHITENPTLVQEEKSIPNTETMLEKEDFFDSEISLKLQSVLENCNIEPEYESEPVEEDINPDITELLRTLLAGGGEENVETRDDFSFETEKEDELPPFDIDAEEPYIHEEEDKADVSVNMAEEETFEEDSQDLDIEEEQKTELASFDIPSTLDVLSDFNYDNESNEILNIKERELSELKEINKALSSRILELENENAKFAEIVSNYEKEIAESRRERRTLIEALDAAKRREDRERDMLAEAAKIAVAERYESEAEAPVVSEEDDSEILRLQEEEKQKELLEEAVILEEAKREAEKLSTQNKAEAEKSSPVRYVSKNADISFRHPVDPNITKRIQEIIVTTVKYFGKEDVYMKIKATIPDPYMVRLEFVAIPENESALLTDIIRVLGHSKIGITKVLLD